MLFLRVVLYTTVFSAMICAAAAGPKRQRNRVTASCPQGEWYRVGCVVCPCVLHLAQGSLAQFSAHNLKVCAGKIPPDDCPHYTCETTRLYLTECETNCTCDPVTRFTTCDYLPCAYE